MTAVIDRDGCIGCELCAETCPEVFQMAEDGLAEVIGEVTDENKELAEEAAESCPADVITIEN